MTYGTIRKIINSTIVRIFVAISVPAIFLFGLAYLYYNKSPFFCINYSLFHIYCPGCGTGRALYDIVHLNFIAALDHNILFTLLLPIFFYVLLKLYIIIIFKKDILPFFKITKFRSYALIIIILAFFVSRNIPLFPFTILAP